ncbi:MAG: 7-carboxy-7-deazaguanine synthase QueE [Kiritimatiellae bacterium]|jgi:7-carboxy-7-deazaguanine synthase|nr:7-carboxy-7-deazaguanine synthase QueE [Kiritimatiellia bacterium]
MENERKVDGDILYPVVEIFQSCQGEGFNTGREVVFLRMGGCNLACPWCDTSYNDFKMMDSDAIFAAVETFGIKSMIITGGEPLVVKGLKSLVKRFKHCGYWIAVESNGVTVAEDGILNLFDYITVSPKACYADLYVSGSSVCKADEVRVAAEDNVLDFCHKVSKMITARKYYLSPCERDGVMNIEQTIRLLGWLNQSNSDCEWLLSLQTHKLCGMK